MTLAPDDLVDAADLVRGALLAHLDADWERPAAHVDWSCRQVVAHLGALAYPAHLATRATAPVPSAVVVDPTAPLADLVTTAHTNAVILAEVARAAPPGSRAWHPAGLADAEGFVGMHVDELLVHAADIATDFEPPADLVRRLLDRLFPWWPSGEADPWPALLWANGRLDLPSRPSPGGSWVRHCRPLDEWDGTVPVWGP